MSRGMQDKFSGSEFGVPKVARRVVTRDGFHLQISCRTQEASCVPDHSGEKTLTELGHVRDRIPDTSEWLNRDSHNERRDMKRTVIVKSSHQGKLAVYLAFPAKTKQ